MHGIKIHFWQFEMGKHYYIPSITRNIYLKMYEILTQIYVLKQGLQFVTIKNLQMKHLKIRNMKTILGN